MNEDKNNLFEGGLQLLTPDADFSLGAIFDLPKLEELPAQFSLGSGWIEDQIALGEMDFCPAHTTCGMSELQEGVYLSRKWQMAAIKEISGDIDSFGATIRDAMKSHVKLGAVEESWLTEEEKALTPYQARRIENYRPELKNRAAEHKKETFFSVTGPYDWYDNARASIWKFREKKQAVAMGLVFTWPKSDYVLAGITDIGSGHMMYATGWGVEGIEVVNSRGLEAGKSGRHLVTREVFNYYAPRYGSMMMVDLSKEEALFRLKHNIKDSDSKLSYWIKAICGYFKS